MPASLSIKEAAEMLGKSQQFIRVGLQRGILPFGVAIKLSSKWTYHIPTQKLLDYLGIKEAPTEGAEGRCGDDRTVA